MRPSNCCKPQLLILVLLLFFSGSVWAQERPPSPERRREVSEKKVDLQKKEGAGEGENRKPAQLPMMRLVPARRIPADANRQISISFSRDNRLRLTLISPGANSVSRNVTRYLERVAEKTLPKMYAYCELSELQVEKQAMAARAEIKSVEYAIRLLESELRGKSLADAGVVRKTVASVAALNTRIAGCFDVPESLFQKVLQRQLSARQLSLYEQYQTLKFDKLSSFVAATARLAVLSPEKSQRLAAIMEKAMQGQAPRTLQDCANTFLSPSTQESAAKILTPSELASAKRLSHYYLKTQ